MSGSGVHVERLALARDKRSQAGLGACWASVVQDGGFLIHRSSRRDEHACGVTWQPDMSEQMDFWKLGIVAVVVVGGAVTVGAKGFSSSSNPTHRSATKPVAISTPESTTASVPQTTTTTAPPPSPDQLLANWFSTTGQADLASLTSDFSAIGSGPTGDLAVLSAECQTLGADVSVIRTHPPIPNATMEQAWDEALGDWSQGVSDCTTGIAENNDRPTLEGSTVMESGVTEIDFLNSDLVAAGLP